MTKLMIAVYLALLICPFIAILLTAPAVYYQYRKNRIIDMMRCADFYLMITFTFCAYFLTMLPFPSFREVNGLTTPRAQLIPFYWLYDFFSNSGLVISDWTTVFPALTGGIMLGVVFNIIMLLPSGFFTRRLYNISMGKAALIGFLISLVFELTQLSGLFFIYSRPYRVFDVDDLMQNTLGFVLGAAIAVFAEKRFKSRINIKIRQGGEVSYRRRFKANFIDQILVFALSGGVIFYLYKSDPYFAVHPFRSFPIYFLIVVVLNECLGLLTYVTEGKSIGMFAIGLRLRDENGGKPSLSQCVSRSFMYAIYINLPFLIGWFISLSRNRHIIVSIICTFVSAEFVFLYVCLNLSLVLYIITHGEKMMYEKVTKTHLGLDANVTVRRRQKVFYRNYLDLDSIHDAVSEVENILIILGVEKEEAVKLKAIVGVGLYQWMEDGLYGHSFTVQMDKRWNHKNLLICVYGKRVDLARDEDSELEKLANMRMSYDSYYTGGINVFAIELP